MSAEDFEEEIEVESRAPSGVANVFAAPANSDAIRPPIPI